MPEERPADQLLWLVAPAWLLLLVVVVLKVAALLSRVVLLQVAWVG
jgi:hypothetical protein